MNVKQRSKMRQSKQSLTESDLKLMKAPRYLPTLTTCMPRKDFIQMRKNIIDSTYFFDAKELRRHKTPIANCLYNELIEEGYDDAADYFKELIRENDEMVNADDIGIAVNIRKNKNLLEKIAAGLKEASQARKKKNIKNESCAFLKLGLSLAEEEKGILWVAEKCFLLATAVAAQTCERGGHQEASCLFAHGRFILDKFPSADMSEAEEMITRARFMSNGKQWDLDEFLIQSEPSGSVFANCSALLHKIYICRARNIRPFDPYLSERLCRIAKRRGSDSGNVRLIASALVEMGLSQMETKDFANALNNFKAAFILYVEGKHAIGMCEVYSLLSAVLIRIGEDDTAVAILTKLGSLAIKFKLINMLGTALRLLGEFYLMKYRTRLAATHLSEAYYCLIHELRGYAALMGKYKEIVCIEDEGDNISVKSSCNRFTFGKRASSGLYKSASPQNRAESKLTSAQPSCISTMSRSTSSSNTSSSDLENIADKIELKTEHVSEELSEVDESLGSEAIFPETPDCIDSIKEVFFAKIDFDVDDTSAEENDECPEEAEQCRFLNAVAFGQSRMESYFQTIFKCQKCNVAVAKMLNWKAIGWSWQFQHRMEQQVPCECPEHNRTALDVAKHRIQHIGWKGIRSNTEKVASSGLKRETSTWKIKKQRRHD